MKIELKNLTLQFPDKPPLFQGLNLSLNSGDFMLFHGNSGSGKSSLLRLFNRLQEPSEGEILVDGKPVKEYEVTELRRKIGYVQQVPVMVEGSVRDNLIYPFKFQAAAGAEAPNDSELKKNLETFLLEGVTLEEDAEHLSVGQKQRIALIRTLLTGPEVILGDEPTSALDETSKGVVEKTLEQANLDSKTAVVLVTHLNFQPKKIRPRRFSFEQDGLTEVKNESG